MQHLKALYNARLFNEVLGECERAKGDPQYADYQPQILYVHWVVSRQPGRIEQASAIQRDFLICFPDYILAADVYFSDAMNLLAGADYISAGAKLKMICNRFPTATISVKAHDILQWLQSLKATTAPNP